MKASDLNQFINWLLLVSLSWSFTSSASDCETVLKLINEPINIESLINELYPRDLVKNPKRELLSFSADEISLKDGLVHFTRPKLENQPIFLFENFCIEFDVSLFGKTICIKSDHRTSDQALCKLMGLIPITSDETVQHAKLAEVSVKDVPYTYVYHDGSWQLEKFGRLMPRGTKYHVLDHFACRIN